MLRAEKKSSMSQTSQQTSVKTTAGADENRRFALDSAVFGQLVDQVVAVGDGLSEIQGPGFTLWGVVEPKAPVNGVPKYFGLKDLKPVHRDFFASYRRSGRELSVMIEFFSNDWALELSDQIMVQSPRTGKQIPGFVRIKKEHEQDFKNFIRYFVSQIPALRYIQIDNEPENVWVSGEGYVRALRLAYEAVQEHNAVTGSDIKVMAAGFYLGPQLISVPEHVKSHVHKNHPDLDEAWLRRELKLPEDFKGRKLKHAAQKIHVVMSVLLQKDPPFDILSIHLDGSRPYDHAEAVMNWYRSQMQSMGYMRPVWIDDMHSGYYPESKRDRNQRERAFFEQVEQNDPSAVARLESEQPKWLVRKAVGYFAAGAERLKIAQLADMPEYFMPEWRYAGLFTSQLRPKPAYYTTKLLVSKLDHFTTATRLSDYVYRFSFSQKDDVFVAWSESGDQIIDLSQALGSVQAKVTFLFSSVDHHRKPVAREPVIVASEKIPLADEPIFIEPWRPSQE